MKTRKQILRLLSPTEAKNKSDDTDSGGKAAEAAEEKGNRRLFNTVVRSRLEGFISQLHS